MYKKRYIEEQIARKLRTAGAVVVSGPKFCGKTTTCMRFQKSFVKLNTKKSIQLAELDPKATLVGDNPRLIDEWQTVPDIWNAIKDDLDDEYSFGKYILTGSSTPADKTDIMHSGAGRITVLKMRPMSLYESGESDGSVSLSSLFEGEYIQPSINEYFFLEDAAFLICRGGWPISVLAEKEIAIEITRNYYNGLFYFENSKNEKFRSKSPEVLRMIMRSYARNISTEASIQTIIEDVKQSNERTMDTKTFNDYMEALRDLYIIEDLSAWSPSIRSKTSIRSTPTRHFADTSLACAALNIFPSDLLDDIESFGLFFEDFAVRDLSIYSSFLGGEVKHYRDNAGLECDAVIHLPDGRWGAIEIKIGGDDAIHHGARTLNMLKRKIRDKSKEPLPSFMMILTATGPCYRREDGIYVVPINKLRA